MVRTLLAVFTLTSAAFPAWAGEPGQPTPQLQALGHMVQECQGREADALIQAYALHAKLAAETKRADEAEAKLKAASGRAPD